LVNELQIESAVDDNDDDDDDNNDNDEKNREAIDEHQPFPSFLNCSNSRRGFNQAGSKPKASTLRGYLHCGGGPISRGALESIGVKWSLIKI
jgi:hypothetical protein